MQRKLFNENLPCNKMINDNDHVPDSFVDLGLTITSVLKLWNTVKVKGSNT